MTSARLGEDCLFLVVAQRAADQGKVGDIEDGQHYGGDDYGRRPCISAPQTPVAVEARAHNHPCNDNSACRQGRFDGENGSGIGCDPV